MKRLRSKAIGSFFLAALLSSPAWGSVPPQPGTINYIEGQAAIDAKALTEQSVGSVKLAAGQSLSTEDGRVEILLTPGILLRVGDHSSVQMVSPGLADTIVTLQKGRAMIEVADIRPENNVRLNENGSSTQLLKPGLYDFNADRNQISVFDGQAVVQASGRHVKVTRGHELNLNVSLNSSGKLKPQAFDEKKAATDDFYRWASLRSSYLAEANVDAARTYAGGSGWSPSPWYGDGWYWDASFDAYTFIPGDGIFFDPFGWGFYSPWLAFEAPYYGYGYGYGFGYGYAGGGYNHRFGSGYRPPLSAGNRSSGFGGRAHSVGGAGMSGFRGRSGFGGGGVRAGAVRSGGFGGGGFSGGGVRAGGSSGGGFHGGGGGGGFHGGGGGGHGR